MLKINRSPESLNMPLKMAKNEAIASINTATGNLREKFITAIPGQEMIYLNKEQQAKQFLAEDSEPTDLSDYPFLVAEVGSTGTTVREVAEIFMDRSSSWRRIGARIEHLRVKALIEVNEASDIAEVQAAMYHFENGIEDLR